MALSDNLIAVVAVVLVLQPWVFTSGNFLSPILSPIFDEVCKEVKCGRGTCKPSQNSTFPYACECDPGWKQSRPDNDTALQFLPCVFPDCTLNYSCKEAPSYVGEKEKPANYSLFDPCHWADCGGGTCNKTSSFARSCECHEGYYNLFNVTAFPCFRDCELGMDCSDLGITVMNKSSPSSSPSTSDNSSNQAISIPFAGFHWVITAAVNFFLAASVWQ